jgi:ribonuclease Z
MQIHFLGTGNAFNADGRATTALLFRPDEAAPFLLDCGPDLMRSLVRSALDFRSLDRLFLTHHHGDHVAGWPFLLLHLVIQHRRTRPFEVVGPAGSRECLEMLARTCFGEVLRLQEFEIRYRELAVEPAEGLSTDAGPRFDVLPMQHQASSIGYRFHQDGLAFAATGDTAWCDNLERLASGSDCIALECTSLRPLPGSHVSLEELREKAPRLGSTRIFLVHLTDEVATELARDPIPNVVAAHDGFSLRTGSD